MFRRLFYTAAALSTLLLLATLILWPVSHYQRLYVTYGTAGEDQYELFADGGRTGVEYVSTITFPRGWDFGTDDPFWKNWRYLSWNTPDPDIYPTYTPLTFLGVCWFHFLPGAWRMGYGALIPFSYLALLFSILPLLTFRSIRRRRKAARVGLCPKCGYDLRAQRAGAAGAVCPECGTPVVAT